MRVIFGSELKAPARLFCAAGLMLASSPATAQAQPASQDVPAVVDMLVASKLVWSAIAALDHANKTGNYSVLRDLGAPSFQANNPDATLAAIFQSLRAQQIDLANALLVMPAFEFPPALVQGGLLRARGSFPLRPTGIGFDLLFQNVSGQWRIFGIAVVPLRGSLAQPPAGRR